MSLITQVYYLWSSLINEDHIYSPILFIIYYLVFVIHTFIKWNNVLFLDIVGHGPCDLIKEAEYRKKFIIIFLLDYFYQILLNWISINYKS